MNPESQEQVNRSCFNCKNLRAVEADLICYIFCSKREKITLTFSELADAQEVAKDCSMFEEEL